MDKIPEIDALLTEKQAAAALSIENGTLAAWRRRGIGPKFLRLPTLGTGAAPAVRYRRTDIESFITAALQGCALLDSLGSIPNGKDFR